MTSPAQILFGEPDAWPEGLPDGTVWPGPDTLVLMNRQIRSDTDPSRLSRFADDRWDLNPGIFEGHARSQTLNFEIIPEPLRLATKFYIWQLINHPKARTLRRSATNRMALHTVEVFFYGSLQHVLKWFVGQGITEFCQVTNDMLWVYLDALDEDGVAIHKRYRRITEVRRLWIHRNILPFYLRLPEAPPWDGEDTKDLLERTRGDRENRTKRIGEQTMQPLLRWAIRFLEDFSKDILAAWDEYRLLQSRRPEHRRGMRRGRKSGELQADLKVFLDGLRSRGEGLPGTRRDDGTLEPAWRHIASLLDCSAGIQITGSGRMILESGLPIADDCYLDTPVTADLDGQPWHPRIPFDEAPRLARLLSTACFIIVAYLSGARVGEVLNLRRGCVSHDKDLGLWLMEGLYFKGAEDEEGNKIPEGTVREDPWVIIEIAAKAVAMLEQLHDSHLLFPNRLKPIKTTPGMETKRRGEARADRIIADDITKFIGWVNEHCRQLGRKDHIPADAGGSVAPSRFRRTLAWFIRRKTRGLIAASIQYGHAYTQMLQGYAGSYEAGFLDDYAFEDWLFRMEGIAEDERRLLAGEHVSGPAADAYRYRVQAASREFAGRVLNSERHARDVLGNPLLQIHHGDGMTCVLNPALAACQLRGSVDDPMVTPDTDDCRPNCQCLAHTDRDIEINKVRAGELAEIVNDTLAPPIRHAREKRELDRLLSIIEQHEHGARP
jgi:integrase